MSTFTKHPFRWSGAVLAAVAIVVAGAVTLPVTAQAADTDTTTPIKHVVVLFDENESYDHYFGTYPTAANTDGVSFTAAPGTPANNNLVSSGALTSNPNVVAPFRLTHEQALTCSQNHGYTAEQNAVNNGAMDKFVQSTSSSPGCGSNVVYSANGLGMGYFDGNTTTALWNYAQNYSLSDNFWDTTFGPSTPGAVNLISGQTANAVAYVGTSSTTSPTPNTTGFSTALFGQTFIGGSGTLDSDPDPAYDDCSNGSHTGSSDTVGMSGKNIGDLLNDKGVSWGWFQGGFAPTTAYSGAGTFAVCGASQVNVGGNSIGSYSPHHNPFEYYKSTSNPHHLAPSSDAMIGKTDQANHEYDLSAFTTTLQNGNLPAVSFLKAAQAEDGHPGSSDPLDEQKFLTREINAIQQSSAWSSTAIVIAYDDSDGWYDHQAPTILNGSSDAASNASVCLNAPSAGAPAGGYQDRCGPSQRLPMLVISPFSRQNYIDHTSTEQTSIIKFIERNWSTGGIGDASFDSRAGSLEGMFDFQNPQQHTVLLNPDGSVVGGAPAPVPPAGGSASSTAVTVGGSAYGIPATAHVTVTTAGHPAGGVVDLAVDGKVVASQTLVGATGAVALPATVKPGHHAVVATFRGSADATASAGSTSVTIAKGKVAVALKLAKHAKRGHTRLVAKITLAEHGSKVVPTGKLKITVGGHTVKKVTVHAKSKGHVSVKLPAFSKAGKQHVRVVFAATKLYKAAHSSTKTVRVR